MKIQQITVSQMRISEPIQIPYKKQSVKSSEGNCAFKPQGTFLCANFAPPDGRIFR